MSSWIPNPTQRLLLRAALLDEADAAQALSQWSKAIDFDDIDYGSTRLVPLLYRNITRLGLGHRDIDRMKGIHKRSWYSTLLLVHRVAPIVAALQAEGIECFVLKGLGLRELAYSKDLATRPVGDADILVSKTMAPRAVTLLTAWGFSSPSKDTFGPAAFASYHAFGFSRNQLEEFDLHWRPLYYCRDAQFGQRLQSRAIQFELGGVRTQTLIPTDHLLMTLAHASNVNVVPPIRWVADASLLIRHNTIDWQLLIDEARATRNVMSVVHGLLWIREHLNVSIPETVVNELENLRSTVVDRLIFATRTAKVSRRSAAFRLGLDYVVRTESEKNLDRVSQFPRYVKATLSRGDANWGTALKRVILYGPKGKP
jgi:hypothetical protein